MDWLIKARAGCPGCDPNTFKAPTLTPLQMLKHCRRRDEHQRTAVKMAEAEAATLDAVLAGRTTNEDSEIDRRVRALRQRGPTDAD